MAAIACSQRRIVLIHSLSAGSIGREFRRLWRRQLLRARRPARAESTLRLRFEAMNATSLTGHAGRSSGVRDGVRQGEVAAPLQNAISYASAQQDRWRLAAVALKCGLVRP